MVATAPITLQGLQTIDGVALSEGERVLVTDQADGKRNGIYTASESTWPRARDMSRSLHLKYGTTVFVTSGTVGGGTLWTLTAPVSGDMTIDSTSLTFEEIVMGGGGGDIEATSIDGGAAFGFDAAGAGYTNAEFTSPVITATTGFAGPSLEATSGALDLVGATGVRFFHGTQTFATSLAAGVSRFVGAGASGTLLEATAGNLVYRVATGSYHSFYEGAAGEVLRIYDNSGNSEIGYIQAGRLAGPSSITITAGSHVNVIATTAIYEDAPDHVFRDASGSTVWASIAGTGALTLPVVAAASVATPAAGRKTLFFNSSNANKLTSKDSAGVLVVIGTET